jgi:hypothetical protein
MFIRISPFLKSERLSIKSKLTFYKALIRSKMTYACPAWEFAADSHVIALQRLQNRVVRTTAKLPRRTPTRALYLALQIPYVNDYITKICRKQVEAIQNRDHVNVQNTGKREAQHRKHKRRKSKLVAVRYTTVQASELP